MLPRDIMLLPLWFLFIIRSVYIHQESRMTVLLRPTHKSCASLCAFMWCLKFVGVFHRK